MGERKTGTVAEERSYAIWRNQRRVLGRTIASEVRRRRVRTLLDIGAGDGRLAVPVARLVESYVAVEADEARAEALREAGLSVIKGRFPDVDVPGDFDLVVASHSLPDNEEAYQGFLGSAWGRVRDRHGSLLVITFVGSTSSRRKIARSVGLDIDGPNERRLSELQRVLVGLGHVAGWEVTSQSWTCDLNEIVQEVISSFIPSASGRRQYEERVADAIRSDYSRGHRYVLSHGHRVFAVSSRAPLP